MKKTAFTLVELLVVIAIIGILVAILVPTVGSGIEKSRKMKCLGQLRQISLAAQSQFDDSKRWMPYRENAGYYGQACYNLMQYLGDDPSVFQCPSQRHPVETQDMLIKDFDDTQADTGVYTTYEINGWLCSCSDVGRQQTSKSKIVDYSQAAIAYDFPYKPTDDYRAHRGGINVAYLDGHAGWLPDEEMYIDGGNSESNFYCKGHTVWE